MFGISEQRLKINPDVAIGVCQVGPHRFPPEQAHQPFLAIVTIGAEFETVKSNQAQTSV